MQINDASKMIFVHIPRTGGSWFSYAWNSDKGAGPIHLRANRLWYKNKFVDCGKHGQLSGILEKLDQINYDYTDHKILTLVRHPVDRALSSWVWFSEVKETAKKHQWKSIDDMLDDYESGTVRANFMPQVFWLEEHNAKFDIIYKFEDLIGNSKVVQKDFPLFNRAKKHSNLLRRGRNKGYHKFLDSRQIQRIKEVYKHDIRFLNKYYDDLK